MARTWLGEGLIMRLLTLSDLHMEFAAPQPSSVCGACGERFGLGTMNEGATWHTGPCGVCGLETGVTEPRDFGGLRSDWNLGLPDPSLYDIVVLAGDIHSHTRAIPWAAGTFSKPVIYVPGNHEFYSAHYQDLWTQLRQCAAEYSHVHLLDEDSIEIDGVRILGTMLWTDFLLFGSDLGTVDRCLHDARNGILDFDRIRFLGGNRLTPADTVRLHRESVAFLNEALGTPFDGKTVVVTHHLPSMKSVADRFKQSLLSAAFASNLDHLVAKADLWVHGHTHDSSDYRIGKCRVVCNPRGYPDRLKNRYENSAFNPTKIVDLDLLGKAEP
jgi:predicted phosphodiesterase